MSRRRKFSPNTKKNNSFTLNITSMTDMFTIMLVFLLQTYSTADVQIEPEAGIRLPASKSENNPVDSVKMSISKNAIKIGSQVFATVQSNEVATKDLDPHDANFIVPVFNELDKMAKDATKGPAKDGKIILQADSSLPYSTIRKVMYTASMAGYPQLKLVTVLGN